MPLHGPLWSELGIHEPAKARFWPWLEPFSEQKSFSNHLSCSLPARKRSGVVQCCAAQPHTVQCTMPVTTHWAWQCRFPLIRKCCCGGSLLGPRTLLLIQKTLHLSRIHLFAHSSRCARFIDPAKLINSRHKTGSRQNIVFEIDLSGDGWQEGTGPGEFQQPVAVATTPAGVPRSHCSSLFDCRVGLGRVG